MTTKFFSVAALALTIGACADQPTSPEQLSGPASPAFSPAFSRTETGNGAPSGQHYTLNIIGVPKDKNPNMDAASGHVIFVDLGKNGDAAPTKILLTEGDFQVLDKNGTDGQASFQLPNPDVDGDGVTTYSVFVRALGKPGGKAGMQSCYTDLSGTWCAVDFIGGVEPIEIVRSKGPVAKFVNESKNLLYVDYCAAWDDTNLDGIFQVTECTDIDQIPLFGADAEFFWSYDNEGLRVAQLRFYPGYATDTGWVNE